jgi:hypothetical protein
MSKDDASTSIGSMAERPALSLRRRLVRKLARSAILFVTHFDF